MKTVVYIYNENGDKAIYVNNKKVLAGTNLDAFDILRALLKCGFLQKLQEFEAAPEFNFPEELRINK